MAQPPDRINPPETVVPNLRGTPESAWGSILARARLRLGRVIERDSDRPAGTILRQEPEAGSRARPNDDVAVFVSNGRDRNTDRTPSTGQAGPIGVERSGNFIPPDPIVPDLERIPREAWSQVLFKRGLELGRPVAHGCDRPEGTLVGQRPPADMRVKRGTPVYPFVSTGKCVVDPNGGGSETDPIVPDLERIPREAWSQVLFKRGLELGKSIPSGCGRPEGALVRQQPLADMRVRRGTPVYPFVSTGKCVVDPNGGGSETDPIVPDLERIPREAWSQVLFKRGLELGKSIPSGCGHPEGTLVRQQPPADTRVKRGTSVYPFVSTGKCPSGPTGVKVPYIVGQFIKPADQILYQHRLRLGNVKWVESSQPYGTVLDQRPQADQVVAVDSPVYVLASQGPRVVPPPPTPVRVPNIVGELVDPARLVLEKYRLRLDDVKWMESSQPRGMVLRQDPSPEEVVKVWSEVDVVVSQGPPPIVRATVPAVVGEYLEAAVIQVRNATLQPGSVRTVQSRAAKGTVVAQSPGAGAQVDRNSLVYLDVSAGEPLATVPNLVNGFFDAAGPALENARLQIGSVTREEATLEAGRVVGQDPGPGSQVPQNTRVNLRVSLGDPWTYVPDLLRTDLRSATRLLADKKLRLGVVERKAASTSPGIVLEQSQRSGSKVLRGTPIDVVVSIEPPPVVVPDLVQRSEDDARAALTKTRLQIGLVSRQEASVDAGVVIAQEPAAGSSVPPGTRVNLRVSLGEPPAIVPALTRLNLETATGLLRSANLQLGAVQRGESRPQADIVLAQSPQAGSQVRRGTVINIVVSTEEPLVVVPNLVQSSEEDARAALATLQLEVGDIQRREAGTRAGLVLSQSVVPGTRVPPGTRIGLAVSVQPPPATVPDRPADSANVPPVVVPPTSPPAGPSPDQVQPPETPPRQPPADVPRPPVDPWWSQITQLPWSWVTSLGFGALYGFQRLRARGKSAPDSPKAEPPPVPQIDVLPRLDEGWQDIAFQDEDETSLGLELTFTQDAGVQRVVEEFRLHCTEPRHEYSDTDTEGPVRDRQRRAS